MHDAFWRAGGAAGINDVVGVVGARLDIKKCRTLSGHPIEQERRAVGIIRRIHHHVLEGGQCDTTVGELCAFDVINKQMPGTTVRHHRGQLLRGCRGRERCSTAARGNGAEIHQCVANGRGTEYGNRLTLLQALGL